MPADPTKLSDRQFTSGRCRHLQFSLFDRLEDVSSLWTGFEGEADHYVFQTYKWCATWLDTVGKHQEVKPYIAVAFDEAGDAIMLLPLCLGGNKLVRRIGCVGGQEADYQAPLVSKNFGRDYDAECQLEMLRQLVSLLPDHDVLAFERIPEFIGEQKNPLCHMQPQRHFEDAFFARLSSDCDEFLRERCGAKTLQGLRRKRRKLGDAGVLRFVVAEAEADVRTMLDELFAQKSEQYRETGAADILAKPGRRDFYTALAFDGRESGRSHLCALKVGGSIVAAHWGMIDGDRFYYLFPSYTSGTLRKFSPGELLLLELFEWCTQRNISIFDFTTGDEPYKLRWSQERLKLFTLTLTPTIRGNIYRLVSNLMRRLKLTARQSTSLWRIVGWARARGFIN